MCNAMMRMMNPHHKYATRGSRSDTDQRNILIISLATVCEVCSKVGAESIWVKRFGTSVRFVSRSMQNNAHHSLEPIMGTMRWRSTCPDADGIINSQTHYQPLGCDCCNLFLFGRISISICGSNELALAAFQSNYLPWQNVEPTSQRPRLSNQHDYPRPQIMIWQA